MRPFCFFFSSMNVTWPILTYYTCKTLSQQPDQKMENINFVSIEIKGPESQSVMKSNWSLKFLDRYLPVSPNWPGFIACTHSRTLLFFFFFFCHTFFILCQVCWVSRSQETCALLCGRLTCNPLLHTTLALIEMSNTVRCACVCTPWNSVHCRTLPCIFACVCVYAWYVPFACCLTSRGRPCPGRMSSCSLIGLSHGGGRGGMEWWWWWWWWGLQDVFPHERPITHLSPLALQLTSLIPPQSLLPPRWSQPSESVFLITQQQCRCWL